MVSIQKNLRAYSTTWLVAAASRQDLPITDAVDTLADQHGQFPACANEYDERVRRDLNRSQKAIAIAYRMSGITQDDATILTHCTNRAPDGIFGRDKGDPGEGTTCWPAAESTTNMNTNKVGRLGLSDSEEDAIVSFMQALSDGYVPANQK